MKFEKTRRGFTILEVVLVLAIAGLIFLMVFIALPALQRSRRDTARRNDTAIIAAAVRQYMANNSGQGPPSSGSVASTTAFDDDERKDLEWQSGNDSPELRKYLTDLNDDVTTVVSVENLVRDRRGGKITNSMRLTIGDSDMSGQVSVYIGARCPERESRTNTMSLDITYKNSDVAIFRYLESGWWFCHNM